LSRVDPSRGGPRVSLAVQSASVPAFHVGIAISGSLVALGGQAVEGVVAGDGAVRGGAVLPRLLALVAGVGVAAADPGADHVGPATPAGPPQGALAFFTGVSLCCRQG
ncbi:hypothetical protein B4Q13_25630, partial [Lacticaseibacillus rhamnosus]